MIRSFVGVAIILALQGPAYARIFSQNDRLDHALWPAHDPKLVVAGTIVPGGEAGKIGFQVSRVILGEDSYRGKTLKIPVESFIWPEALVPCQKGSPCILVLRLWDGKYYLYTVVPGRERKYPRAADTKGARTILAEELLAQLKAEKSAARQRALLLQLAPILAKEKAGAVEGFLKSPDPWVRRAALAALVYATEAPRFLEPLAKDVQAYFARTKGAEWVDGLEPGVRMRPKALLLEHYFFLEGRGSRWDDQEAEKYLRILKGVLRKKVIEDRFRKVLLDEE